MSNDQPRVIVKEEFKDDPSYAKLVQVVEKLNKYLDFSPEFLENFPDNLPRKFLLKLGPNVIGFAVIDWKAVGGKLFHAFMLNPKPPELSEDEYFELVKSYFESLSPKDAFTAMLPSFSTMWHMLENLPQKVNDAIVHLAMEGREKVVIEQQQKLGKSVPSPAKFADEIAKMERQAIKGRLPKLQPTKTKPAWQNESNLIRYAERVETLQLLCQCMKNVYERCDFLEDWAEDLRNDQQFKLLSPDVAPKAINWAIRHIGDDGVSPREKEPVSLACEAARLELDLPEQDIETLRGYYQAGMKLVRAKRKKLKSASSSRLLPGLSTAPMDTPK